MAAAALEALPAAALVPPPTVAARVERAFLDREVDGGERLRPGPLAAELGGSPSRAQALLRRLRALREQDPGLAPLRTRFAAVQRLTPAELDAAREQARRKHLDAIEVGAWWRAAACRGMDTALFFPDRRDAAAAARAKRVCAACPVRPQCLAAELAAPVGRAPEGIAGGQAPAERTRLRVAGGLAANANDGRLLADRDLTEQAHRRARELGVAPAAAELATTARTLLRAFDRWGLPVLPPRPPRFATLEQAGEAHALARRVGIDAAARQLGVGYRTLRQAFARHALAWPPPRPAPVRPVDPAFFALNPAVLVPRGLAGEALAARVRRQEAFDVLGPRVAYALGDENRTRPQARAWFVAQRARTARRQALAARLAPRPGPAATPPAPQEGAPS